MNVAGKRFCRSMLALSVMALHRSLITYFAIVAVEHRMLFGISCDLMCLGLITLVFEGWKTRKETP